MRLVKIFLVIFSLVLVACGGGDKKKQSDFAPPPSTQVPDEVPQQSFVVRTNPQTGQAEYATANFDSSTDQRQLEQMAGEIQNWEPIQQQQILGQNTGYNSNSAGAMYFSDPRLFNGRNPMAHQQGIYGGRGYNYPGSYRYGYYGIPNYGRYNHYYPQFQYQNFGQYYYQPTYCYSVNCYYWNPCYTSYYPSYGYQYSFYARWW